MPSKCTWCYGGIAFSTWQIYVSNDAALDIRVIDAISTLTTLPEVVSNVKRTLSTPLLCYEIFSFRYTIFSSRSSLELVFAEDSILEQVYILLRSEARLSLRRQVSIIPQTFQVFSDVFILGNLRGNFYLDNLGIYCPFYPNKAGAKFLFDDLENYEGKSMRLTLTAGCQLFYRKISCWLFEPMLWSRLLHGNIRKTNCEFQYLYGSTGTQMWA